MIGNKKYAKVNQTLNTLLEEKQFLIVTHRGSWGGNIIENTKESVEAAISYGADLVEIDVIQSKDKEYFCFHTNNEFRLFRDGSIDVQQLTSEEIQNLYLYNSIGEQTLQSLDEVVEGITESSFIHLDRSWFFWEDFLPILAEKEYRDSIILKSPVNRDLLNLLESCETRFMYTPIIENMAELELVKEFDINIVGLELLASAENDDFYNVELVESIKEEMNVFILLNAIVLNDTRKLFAGYDDNISITKGPEFGWGKLLEHGADVIHTDWTAELNQYRSKLN